MSQIVAASASHLQDLDHRMDQFAQALQIIMNPDQAAAQPAQAPVQVPVQAPVAPSIARAPGVVIQLAPPPSYSGDPTTCRGFLNQMAVHFEMSPESFPSDRAKVGFLMNSLTGKALLWITPLWEKSDPIIHNFAVFSKAFRGVFDPPYRTKNLSKALWHIKQGSRSVTDYAIEFRTISSQVDWSQTGLITAFMEGLSDSLQDEVAGRDLPEDLEGLIAYLSQVDDRIRLRRNRRERSHVPVARPPPRAPRAPSPPPDEPMQLGSMRLSEAEKALRRREGSCLYCGNRGHLRLQCPSRPNRSGPSENFHT